jgi:hypothetical protein
MFIMPHYFPHRPHGAEQQRADGLPAPACSGTIAATPAQPAQRAIFKVWPTEQVLPQPLCKYAYSLATTTYYSLYTVTYNYASTHCMCGRTALR